MITAGDPRIQAFLAGWHEEERARFEHAFRNLDYDTFEPKRAKERRKYIALDSGTSGAFLVDRETGKVFTIKAYGVPYRCLGTLETVIEAHGWRSRYA